MRGQCPLDAGRAGSGDDGDSVSGGDLRPSTWWHLSAVRPLFTFAGIALAAGAAVPGPAWAQAPHGLAGLSVGTLEVIQAAVFAGVMGAAMLSAIWLIRERARTAADNEHLQSRVADLNASLQRSEGLLSLRDQRIVVWSSENSKPELVGALPGEAGAPEDRAGFLAFGRWLMPRSAAALEQAIVGLREKSQGFDLVVETQRGAPLEARGRKTASHVLVRFVSLAEAHRTAARFKLENQNLIAEREAVLALLDALDMPFWVRSDDGRLKWVNRAYAKAVEADSPQAAVRDGKEFLGSQVREQITGQQASAPVFEQTVSTVVDGDRRLYAVTDVACPEGSAGIASDRSAAEAIREDYERTLRSHADTLDQLTTAVASFDATGRLGFYNQAFQKLWALDAQFLSGRPDNNAVLDRLRSDGKLAEQPEWRRWKETVLSAYRTVDPQEHWWHLPDGRTIRVIASPQPKGGVTWVFENLTERMDLESRYNSAVRVQGETLDNLAEGVVVFGPDGRVRLNNPAFSRLWGLDPDFVKPNTHISEIRAVCDMLADPSPWPDFAAAVTGFDDERRDRHDQTELKNGIVLRTAVIHLPNGQVMTTFVDVTDSTNVERALTEKNEALRRADELKNAFVQHVSYELRSPLTNIIGFTELLAQPATGRLSERQRDYLEHIGSSSSVLLTIVNDILDLATVDAGIMQLDIGEVDVDQTVRGAAELVAERLREHQIKLDIDVSRAPQHFNADEHRVRQILFNLLSNAANYAPSGSTVTLACETADGEVQFSVHDDGPGMAPEVLDTVFNRFESRTNGGRRRGAGLGLSIVKSFVELHGGTVHIDTARNGGTTVVCRFPIRPLRAQAAAE